MPNPLRLESLPLFPQVSVDPKDPNSMARAISTLFEYIDILRMYIESQNKQLEFWANDIIV